MRSVMPAAIAGVMRSDTDLAHTKPYSPVVYTVGFREHNHYSPVNRETNG